MDEGRDFRFGAQVGNKWSTTSDGHCKSRITFYYSHLCIALVMLFLFLTSLTQFLQRPIQWRHCHGQNCSTQMTVRAWATF